MGSPDEPAHVVGAALGRPGQFIGYVHDRARTARDSTSRASRRRWRSPRSPASRTGTRPHLRARCRRGGSGDVLVDVQSRPLATTRPSTRPSVCRRSCARAGDGLRMRFLDGGDGRPPAHARGDRPSRGGGSPLGASWARLATTPMALFLSGSVNPNAVEIAAGIALWATLLGWFARPDPGARFTSGACGIIGVAALVRAPRPRPSSSS